MITISIITISYNAEAVLLPTLESVKRQTYPQLEYIVVDGASTDGTLSLVASLLPSARVVSEPDRGIYDAMNKGLCLATGDYIWFLNAGDTLRSHDTVERVVEAITKSSLQPDILYGDTMIVDNRWHDLHLRRHRPPQRLTKKSLQRGMLVCHQAFVVRRAIALPYQLCYHLSSDYDWMLRMVARSNEPLFLDQVLVNYLEGGISKRKRWKSLRERFTIMRRHFGLFPTLYHHVTFLFRAVRYHFQNRNTSKRPASVARR